MTILDCSEIIVAEEKKIRIPKVVSVEAARYVSGYKLLIRFDDGHESTVDFGPFLKSSAHPAISAYLNLRRFKQFSIEDGMLHWNDFDLVFPIADLYRGKIS